MAEQASDSLALQELAVAYYEGAHAELDLQAVLAAAGELGASDKLRPGGAIVFPHLAPADCAPMAAAAVQACLDSGADTVLALGPLHVADDEILAGYDRIAAGVDGRDEPLRGIYGPGAPCGNDRSRLEHSLMTWRLCWEAECTVRGLAPEDRPRVVERHPCFAGSRPEDLPGIDELEVLGAGGAAVVASVDPFHHGTPFGIPEDEVVDVEPEGRRLAEDSIRRGISILAHGDYLEWRKHCFEELSDAIDVGQVLRQLLGPTEGELVGLTFSDASVFYDGANAWAAGALWVVEPRNDSGDAGPTEG